MPAEFDADMKQLIFLAVFFFVMLFKMILNIDKHFGILFQFSC